MTEDFLRNFGQRKEVAQPFQLMKENTNQLRALSSKKMSFRDIIKTFLRKGK
jgi:hypothetical protein